MPNEGILLPERPLIKIPPSVAATAVSNGTATVGPSLPAIDATVTISTAAPSLQSDLTVGITHTQYSADNGNDSTAVSRARQLIQRAAPIQNQHIMGWGADDPEPSPGKYNWGSLDERVQLMQQTQGTKVLTLCCAPGWMRPAGYQNDWSNLEVAPDPSHLQDFVALVKQVVLRYADIHYFQVWNELKGMYAGSPGSDPALANENRWDYERYTTLYNAVYDVIKSVRPDAQVGGPYVVMDSDGNRSQMSNPGPDYAWGTLDQRPLDVIRYWLEHKHGADFIAIDGSSANRDKVWRSNEFDAGQKFIDVANWIRQQGSGGATLPIWWAEWYAGDPSSTVQSLAYYNALTASNEIYTLQSGVNVLFLWDPQGDMQGLSTPEGMWTDTRRSGGGQATPYFGTALAFKTYFAPGTQIYPATVSTHTISVLASATATMLVNRLGQIQHVAINGYLVTLQPYQVSLVTTASLVDKQS
ncbi:hypothetical protein KTT_25050 [Tengunoibacter tsumagoiensis]|uniref:Glycoside hydrolase family 42 N-terminal domain-containing protein n=1 Tax=Tengunoibacter tsumagoiensis TaxID=2014871 RepID=A0A402A0R3_9CHLR|nr:hypothetical protein KTT_25050 [Tengunoibacter tsumagoiensis]